MTEPEQGDDGHTSWFVPGESCPACDGPVATDGKRVWCGNGCGWEGMA